MIRNERFSALLPQLGRCVAFVFGLFALIAVAMPSSVRHGYPVRAQLVALERDSHDDSDVAHVSHQQDVHRATLPESVEWDVRTDEASNFVGVPFLCAGGLALGALPPPLLRPHPNPRLSDHLALRVRDRAFLMVFLI